MEVDRAPEKGRELLLQVDERKAGNVARFELDEDVDVALRTEVVAKHGAKERQLADVVTLAELGDAATVGGDLRRHQHRRIESDHRRDIGVGREVAFRDAPLEPLANSLLPVFADAAQVLLYAGDVMQVKTADIRGDRRQQGMTPMNGDLTATAPPATKNALMLSIRARTCRCCRPGPSMGRGRGCT